MTKTNQLRRGQILFPLSLLIIFFYSCSIEDMQYYAALEKAGENRAELESVVEHYEANGESEKVKAVKFLIKNMPGHKAMIGEALDEFYFKLDSVYNTCNGDMMQAYQFLRTDTKSRDWSSLKMSYDINTVTAEYLIDNIDRAFAVKNSPWAKNLSFEEFCESILPYRLADEELEAWRGDYQKQYGMVIDSISKCTDGNLDSICEGLSKLYKAHNLMFPPGVPSIKPSFLKRILIGPCSDYTNLAILIARAHGIPAYFDYTPQWANYPHGHEWCSLLWNGEWTDYMLGEGTELGGHLRKCGNVLTKVFRHTYAIQSRDVIPPAYSKEPVPSAFRNKRFIDVTDLYIPTTDVQIADLYPSDNEFVYLCVWDNQGWNPISWAQKIDNKATFSKIGKREAVYLPAYYNGRDFEPAQTPILVDKFGQVRSLKPTADKNRIVLKRKYLETRLPIFMSGVIGGQIEIANNAKFINSESYIIPDTIECNYQKIDINTNCRYIRFIAAKGKKGQMAEMEIYDRDGNEIFGQLISSLGISDTTNVRKSFDKNTLTYSTVDNTKSNDNWIGIDLGKCRYVDYILFLSRNDDNFIKDGEEYELFFWDDNWKPLGTKIGSKKLQYLQYNNVPTSALLLLRNHTKGTEERVFIYENEKQVWY
ncbi:MAG: transglutaminase-like domain-containing protein [Marinilabiliaceae bacterium]|nr:transglutaminase-like domain-containing protein [Marinilabiliaceae bacterium]